MRKWIPLVVIVVAFGASAAVYSELPDRVPTHWNMAGEVDGWMSRPWGAFVLPGMLVGIFGIFQLLPRIDPRAANYSKFRGTYDVVVITAMLFMLGVHFIILATALGRNISVPRIMPVGVGMLFIVLGNLMPRMRPNWFVGIRTPWTLSSDRVWERTHRIGGRLFVVAGVIIALTGLFAPGLTETAMIGTVVAVTVGVLAYSYFIWKRDPDSRRPAEPSVRE
ncbi:SdpI family protein [soil metagenome]